MSPVGKPNNKAVIEHLTSKYGCKKRGNEYSCKVFRFNFQDEEGQEQGDNEIELFLAVYREGLKGELYEMGFDDLALDASKKEVKADSKNPVVDLGDVDLPSDQAGREMSVSKMLEDKGIEPHPDDTAVYKVKDHYFTVAWGAGPEVIELDKNVMVNK